MFQNKIFKQFYLLNYSFMKKSIFNIGQPKPNPNSKKLDGDLVGDETTHTEKFAGVHANYSAFTDHSSSWNILFFRTMVEADVKAKIFFLEGERGFEQLILREKFSLVAKYGDTQFQKWFTLKEVNETLPKDCINFKEEVIDYFK